MDKAIIVLKLLNSSKAALIKAASHLSALKHRCAKNPKVNAAAQQNRLRQEYRLAPRPGE
jgi:hypothetical protein